MRASSALCIPDPYGNRADPERAEHFEKAGIVTIAGLLR
jgi:hypothetical protein